MVIFRKDATWLAGNMMNDQFIKSNSISHGHVDCTSDVWICPVSRCTVFLPN